MAPAKSAQIASAWCKAAASALAEGNAAAPRVCTPARKGRYQLGKSGHNKVPGPSARDSVMQCFSASATAGSSSGGNEPSARVSTSSACGP